MVWFHVDPNISFQPKVVDAGNCAMGLWVRAGAWCVEAKTDGFLPTHMGVRMGTQKQLLRLVECGLLSTTDGGFKFHDWDHYQTPKETIERRRESERQRKAEQRKSKNVPPGVPPDVRAESQSLVPPGVPPDVRAESSRARPRSALLLSTYLGEVSNGEYGEPPPPPHCDRHMPDGTTDPCRACGQARKQHEAWQATQTKTRTKHAAAVKAELDACPECCGSGHILDDNDRAIPCPRHAQQEIPF